METAPACASFAIHAAHTCCPRPASQLIQPARFDPLALMRCSSTSVHLQYAYHHHLHACKACYTLAYAAWMCSPPTLHMSGMQVMAFGAAFRPLRHARGSRRAEAIGRGTRPWRGVPFLVCSHPDCRGDRLLLYQLFCGANGFPQPALESNSVLIGFLIDVCRHAVMLCRVKDQCSHVMGAGE